MVCTVCKNGGIERNDMAAPEGAAFEQGWKKIWKKIKLNR